MTVSTEQRPAGRAADTRDRLLQATVACARRDGAGAVSLQLIAAEAHVSKALVFYHFRDKDDILATTISWLTARLVARERAALAESTPASVLEELWRWLEGEIAAGELRVLIELTGERGTDARAATQRSAEARAEAADATIARVFGVLGLTPRIPTTMLAATELAFREGVILSAARDPARNPRVAFDVFWLSLLSLTQ